MDSRQGVALLTCPTLSSFTLTPREDGVIHAVWSVRWEQNVIYEHALLCCMGHMGQVAVWRQVR